MPERQSTAMLDCEDGEKDGNSNCKHCQASGENQQRYWDIQLDQDLLETIVSIYPEWFKDCNMNVATEATDSNNSMCVADSISSSSKPTENCESLQRTIDKNKESLKVKLMLRRPLNQLVDQSILPSLKSNPAFHEQKQKLERAKMGDILKHKIQRRPDRQEHIQQHILEDSGGDPNLQDKQRQLKRARLADNLNDRISQRPGPLELVKVNILHADDILTAAVREGSLAFKSTCETPSPSMRVNLEEDSGSDGAFSPSPPYDFSEHSQGSLPSLEASEPSPNPNQGSPCSAVTSFSMSPPSSVSSPLSVLPSVVSPQSAQEQISDYLVHMQQHCGSKETTPSKNRKKSKPKTQPKARTIKFHEYKGPPNAQKNPSASSSALTESSYDLLLQQQQLFLQWQLEWQQKYPQVVLQTSQKTNRDQIGQVNQKQNSTNQTPQQLYEPPSPPQKLLSKLEDLKVSDLKAELKKRNLPVSGPKPLLIERLKSYSELPQSVSASSASQPLPSSAMTTAPSVPSPSTANVGDLLLDNLHSIPTSDCSVSNPEDTLKKLLNTIEADSRPPSTVPSDREQVISDTGDINEPSSTSMSNEDIVQLQQKFIEKLQRELERSQRQLQQSIIGTQPIASPVTAAQTSNTTTPNAHIVYSNSSAASTTPSLNLASTPSTNCESPESAAAIAENKALQRQIIHQCLQQKIHQQQLQLKKQKLMQEVQKQGNSSICSTSSTSSTNSNSTLTALLESGPLNGGDLNLNSVTKAVPSFPSTIMSTQVVDSLRESLQREDDFPGVIPVENKLRTPSDLDASFSEIAPLLVCQSPIDAMATKPAASLPNGITNRSSSLPSFSALLSKPSPTRSNTDPQFLIGRPPPDYNEATRQLSKVKQHHFTNGVEDGNQRQSKKHKSSVKCQAVDDVLEILIKNGELPPSAAQEPTTPATPISTKSDQMFPPSSSSDMLFSKPMASTSLLATTMAQTPAPSDITADSADLHLSLQSVLDMTPPSSAGFGDAGSGPASSLDFDFTLDMQDIENMDLELDDSHHVSSHTDPTLPIPMGKDVKSCTDFLTNHTTGGSDHLLRSNDIQERPAERGVDMDLIEWLEVLEEASTASSTSNSFQHASSYGISNDHEPLFSNSHETLDLFSSDDMEFKPHHDLNFLPWGDKSDFTA